MDVDRRGDGAGDYLAGIKTHLMDGGKPEHG